MYIDAAVIAGLAVVAGCLAITVFGIRFVRANMLKDSE